MAVLVKPHKRSGTWCQCSSVKAKTHSTSFVSGVGEEHILLEIDLTNGEKSILELSKDEAKILHEALGELMGENESIPNDDNSSFAAKVFEEMRKKKIA